MQSSAKPSQNLAGLLKIWAVPLSDIVISISGVEILSTENILAPYCSPESMSIEHEAQTEHGSMIYDTTITGFMPKDCPDTQNILNKLHGRKWIIIYLDGNLEYKVSGSPAIPHRFSARYSSGKTSADPNGHELTFNSIQLTPPLIISNPFPNS